MRRIIERKVTVVTTTTWTISWKDDPLQPSSEADSIHSTESNTDTLSAAQITAPIIEIKEAEITEEPTNLSKTSNLERQEP